jgi:hypothetical protein
MLFCGDAAAAKAQVATLIGDLGFEPVDIGGLVQALQGASRTGVPAGAAPREATEPETKMQNLRHVTWWCAWSGGAELLITGGLSLLSTPATPAAADGTLPLTPAEAWLDTLPWAALAMSAALGALLSAVGIAVAGLHGALPGIVAGPVHAGLGLLLRGWLHQQEVLALAARAKAIEPLLWIMTRAAWEDVHDFGSGLVALLLTPIYLIVDLVLMVFWIPLGLLVAAPRVAASSGVLCTATVVGSVVVCGAIALLARAARGARA